MLLTHLSLLYLKEILINLVLQKEGHIQVLYLLVEVMEYHQDTLNYGCHEQSV